MGGQRSSRHHLQGIHVLLRYILLRDVRSSLSRTQCRIGLQQLHGDFETQKDKYSYWQSSILESYRTSTALVVDFALALAVGKVLLPTVKDGQRLEEPWMVRLGGGC